MKIEFPDDSDGQALKMMAMEGMDMRRAIKFEFSIHVEDERCLKIISEKLKAAGLGDSIESVYDGGELEEGEEMTKENEQLWPSWTVYIHKKMVPSYEIIVEFQKTLTDVCQDEGKPDGWTIEIEN